MRAYAGGGAAAPKRGSHVCERGSGGAGTQAHAYGVCERMRAEVQRRHSICSIYRGSTYARVRRRRHAGARHSVSTAALSDSLSEHRESENQRARTLAVAQEVLVLSVANTCCRTGSVGAFCREATLRRLCMAVEGGCRASICGGCQELPGAALLRALLSAIVT